MKLAGTRLLEALAAHLGPLGDVHAQSEDWVSATFNGHRHIVWFTVDAGATLDAFLADLRDIDFPMNRYFVADIDLIERHDCDGQARVGIAALTIDTSVELACPDHPACAADRREVLG